MSELGGALRDLARTAQAQAPVDPADLWARGRRRVRRRRIAAGVVTLVVVLLGSLAVVRPEPTVVMPAGSPHAPPIPKNVYEPNRFLAGVSKAGPPGRLAVIAAKPGDSDSYYDSWFGISAITGAYRKLDLPDLADDSPMRLSPDGTRIAYWVTGPTWKKDFGPRTHSSEGGPLPDRPLAGVAVYDTRDGSVMRHMIPSDYGLQGGDDATVSWFDDRTLVFSCYVLTGTNSAMGAGSYLWSPAVSEPTKLPGENLESARYLPAYGVPLFVRNLDLSHVVVDVRARPTGRAIVLPEAEGVPDAVTFSGSRVLNIGDVGGNGIARVFVGHDVGRPMTTLTPVGTLVVPHFLGWRSASTILVSAEPGQQNGGELTRTLEGKEAETRWLYSVDLDARKVRRLGKVDTGLDYATLQMSTELLDDPMVTGRESPSLLDVFRVPLGIGAGALLAGAAWFVVRRRRRA